MFARFNWLFCFSLITISWKPTKSHGLYSLLCTNITLFPTIHLQVGLPGFSLSFWATFWIISSVLCLVHEFSLAKVFNLPLTIPTEFFFFFIIITVLFISSFIWVFFKSVQFPILCRYFPSFCKHNKHFFDNLYLIIPKSEVFGGLLSIVSTASYSWCLVTSPVGYILLWTSSLENYLWEFPRT